MRNQLFVIKKTSKEILFTGGVEMAQVSIQYSIDTQLDIDDEQCLTRSFSDHSGVTYVHVNKSDSTLCIDFDDTRVQREALEQCLKQYDYPYSMIDQITIER